MGVAGDVKIATETLFYGMIFPDFTWAGREKVCCDFLCHRGGFSVSIGYLVKNFVNSPPFAVALLWMHCGCAVIPMEGSGLSSV